MKKFLPKSFNNPKGFTLVELLVVISIIAILSMIGITIFTGVQKNARDAKRRGDIDAISKAMEAHLGKFSTGQYAGLCQTAATPTYDCTSTDWFVGGAIPADPSGGTKRYCWISSGTCIDATGAPLAAGVPPQNTSAWVICATLESTNAAYCIGNQQ